MEKQEKSPIELVEDTKKELASYRVQFESDWKDYDNAYYGKQHKTGEQKKTVKNHIFKVIEGEVPILTDSLPGTLVTANTQEKQEAADILNKAISYVYQDQNIPLMLPTLVRSALISAPGYLYPFYNPDADGGEGKIEYKQLPWSGVWLDGNVQNIEQSEKARIEIPTRRDCLIRMYPEKKDELLKVQGGGLDLNVSDSDNFESRDVSSDKEQKGMPKKHSHKDILKYAETWIKDYSLKNVDPGETSEDLIEERGDLLNSESPEVSKWEDHKKHIEAHMALRAELTNQIGIAPDAKFDDISAAVDQLIQQSPDMQDQLHSGLVIVKIIDNHIEEHEELLKINPTSQEPAFKDGWRVIRSVGKVILYDGPNENEDDGIGHIPLVPFYSYKDTTIYGFGEVKNILDAQRTLNEMDFREYNGLKVSANPGWIADHESEVDENQLTNKDGLVILKNRGTEVRRLEPGQVSPQLEQRKQFDQRAIEDISGINEATQGNMPVGSASGVAISRLQAQAIGRVRLKDRYLQHYSMRRLAILTAQLIINHWSTEKRLRLRSDNTNVEEFVFNPLEMEDLEYSVDISAGSMAGIDKDALNAFYMNLLASQHITFEDFLLVADFPKKDILLSKLNERNQQAQQLQELQQQAQQLQEENIKIRGAKSPEMLNEEEKKVFNEAKRQALKKQMIEEANQQETQQEAPQGM